MTLSHPERLRWYVAGLLFLATAVNYLDRQTLSVLAGTIQREQKLTDVQYSWITSSFLLSYTILYAVSGRLVDRIGARWCLTISVAGWSLVSMLHGAAATFFEFCLVRFLLGAFESANFPAAVSTVAEWFPMKERALGIGVFNAGSAVGAAVSVPVIAFLAQRFGWRMAFVATGAAGLVWVVAWTRTYYPLADHPWLSPEQRAEQAASVAGLVVKRQPPPLVAVLRMREAWGYAAVRVLTDPMTYFITFWIPKYFEREQSFSLAQIGRYTWIPFVGLSLGHVLSGVIPRKLVGRGLSVNCARKSTMLVASLVVFASCVTIPAITQPGMAVVLMTAITVGHGSWGNVAIAAEVFPNEILGFISGLGGFCGGVAGIAGQLLLARVVERFSYRPIFFGFSVTLLIALGCVQLLIRDLGVIHARPVEVGA
ncbi:MAG: MFS transporter [Candidatus Solibacter sp.]